MILSPLKALSELLGLDCGLSPGAHEHQNRDPLRGPRPEGIQWDGLCALNRSISPSSPLALLLAVHASGLRRHLGGTQARAPNDFTPRNLDSIGPRVVFWSGLKEGGG